ncbi:hypothetical protein GGR57DRAFT_518288 [Xylariaceae sp. FL1272]|nr:hypothetical protein GGR57DRAFT_518288 [Xylariaceae sp. FL1272]
MSPEAPPLFSNADTPKANHIILALMGMTGSGKSSLISLCTGQEVGIGHELQSCTQDVQTYSFQYPKLPSSRGYLVNTPGFDDTNKSDTEVLRTLVAWLTATYSNGTRVLRHNNTQGSTFTLIEHFIRNDTKIVLDIQYEIVNDHKTLDKTEAGKDVQGMLADQNSKLKLEIQNVETDLWAARKAKDEALAEVMRDLRLQHKQALQELLVARTTSLPAFWDSTTGERLHVMTPDGGDNYAVGVSGDTMWLAVPCGSSAAESISIHVLDLSRALPELVSTIHLTSDNGKLEALSLSLSFDGKFIAFMYSDDKPSLVV